MVCTLGKPKENTRKRCIRNIWQEAWIAGCYGDAELGYCGSSPLGLVVLVGQKSDKTDIHSMAAKSAGVDRDVAKAVLTYGTLYGQGLKGATDGLRKNLPLETTESCKTKADSFLKGFKGRRSEDTKRWVGGLASQAFNYMDKLANHRSPRTPVLGAAMSKALAGQRDFATTRTNWTIQSAGVDFRDLLVIYTRYCFEQLGVRGRLLLTIHDEIRTIIKTEDIRKATYALQLAHVLVRAYFIDSLGLDCIPSSVAWFTAVDVDQVVRKEPNQTCITPSQPEAIKPGYILTPKDLTEYQVKQPSLV